MQGSKRVGENANRRMIMDGTVLECDAVGMMLLGLAPRYFGTSSIH